MTRRKRRFATLIADHEFGEGSVRLAPEFMECDGLFRADVLGDVIAELTVLYRKSLKASRRSSAARARKQ